MSRRTCLPCGIRRRPAQTSTSRLRHPRSATRRRHDMSALHKPSGWPPARALAEGSGVDAERIKDHATTRTLCLVRAWAVQEPGPIDSAPRRVDRAAGARAGPGEVRVRVSVCGVCRTDLHLPRATSRRSVPGWYSATRSWGVVDASVPVPRASRSATDRCGMAPPHVWPMPVSAGVATRTCAWHRASPLGRRWRLRPRWQSWRRTTLPPSPAVVRRRAVAHSWCAGIIGYPRPASVAAAPGGRLGI